MRRIVDNILEKLLITIISVMLIAVIWQVMSRYLLDIPSTLTDEIASFLLIWLGLFGAAYATGKNLHLAIDLIPQNTIAKKPLFFSAIVTVSVICFALFVMVIGGSRLCWITYSLAQRSAALEIPLAYVYMAIPLSGILIIYYRFDSFLNTVKTLKKKKHGLYGGARTGY